MENILQEHKSHCAALAIGSDQAELIIRRSKLLETAFHAIKEPSFNCCRDVLISFVGEDGADAGGPRREFFRYVRTFMIELMHLICETKIVQKSAKFIVVWCMA